MNTIRTTITLPAELHQSLRSKAFRYHKSLNQVIVDQLHDRPEFEYSTQVKDKEKEIEENIKFFKKVGRMGKQIDWMKAIRVERNR